MRKPTQTNFRLSGNLLRNCPSEKNGRDNKDAKYRTKTTIYMEK